MIDGALVVDGHMDTPLRIEEGLDPGRWNEEGHVDLPRLAAGGVDAVFMAAWIDPAFAPDRALARCERLLATIRGIARAHPGRAGLAGTAAEARAHVAAGRIALVPAIEGGEALEGDVGNLARLHALGARLLTLTWMRSNGWGDAAGGEKLHGGLSPAGEELVDAMNEQGVIVDLAHADPATLLAAAARSTAPVVVSHAGTEVRGPHPRNVSDEEIRAVAATGGLVGIALMPAYLDPEDPDRADLDAVADHLERVAEVAGVEHVALGSDFDGVPRLPRGIAGAQDMPRIAERLVARGWEAEALARLLGGNWLRVLEAVAVHPSAASGVD